MPIADEHAARRHPAPFFVPDGEAFVTTESTRGPWSRQHQHGSPPAALLARAMVKYPW
jgi:hypothetical protein